MTEKKENYNTLVRIPLLWKAWKRTRDDGRIYDEVFDFVDGDLSRGDAVAILDYLLELYELYKDD